MFSQRCDEGAESSADPNLFGRAKFQNGGDRAINWQKQTNKKMLELFNILRVSKPFSKEQKK